MPREQYHIDPLKEFNKDEVNKRLSNIATHFRNVSNALANLSGQDGQTIELKSDINLNGKAIRNVGAVQPTNLSSFTSISIQTKLSTLKRLDIIEPADTPASADALRDDIVANTIPSIEEKFNVIITLLGELVDALRGQGAIA